MDWDNWARSQTTADTVGMIQRLQGLRQNHKITELQSQQLAALQRLQRSIDKEASKPKCPWCGGGLEEGFELCKNCGQPVIWLGSFVGKPGQENELEEAQRLAKLEAKKQKDKERKAAKHWENQRKLRKQKLEKERVARVKERVAREKKRADARAKALDGSLQTKINQASADFLAAMFIVFIPITLIFLILSGAGNGGNPVCGFFLLVIWTISGSFLYYKWSKPRWAEIIKNSRRMEQRQ